MQTPANIGRGQPSTLTARSCRVYPAEDLYVIAGANAGDGLGLPGDVVAGDAYMLEPDAQSLQLALRIDTAGRAPPEVAPGSALGQAGEPIHIEARYTLMSDVGEQIELILLSVAGALLVLPHTPIVSGQEYVLLAASDRVAAESARLNEARPLSFARGTRITMASGRQTPVESLVPGDLVLTRDHGAQPLRLLGSATLRAEGEFAPVVIAAGALGNTGDLVISQHHRLFLYRPKSATELPTSEVLVQARDLIDDRHAHIREGGVVDWFGLVFDDHEIVYAEGIPAESLKIDAVTLSALPPEAAAEVAGRFPGLAQRPHFGTEAGRWLIEALGPEGLFRTTQGPTRPRTGRGPRRHPVRQTLP